MAAAPHQTSLLGFGEPAVAPDAAFAAHAARRRTPGSTSPRSGCCGSDTLLAELTETVEWQQRPAMDVRPDGRRSPAEPLVPPVGAAAASRARPPRERCSRRTTTCRSRGPALNYYRDGRDSVAPHADRELRELDDTLVAILTLGARRPFLLRPRGGRPVSRSRARSRRPARDGRADPARLGARGPQDRLLGAPGLGLVALVAGDRAAT